MHNINQISIIGLGLIGGSLAKTIRFRNLPIKTFAYDANVSTLKQAKDEGIIDEYTTTLTKQFLSSDIIFLCAPVEYNNELLNTIKNDLSSNSIITDVGSVKQNIHETVDKTIIEDIFIGGHPMAGSEKSGYNASTHYLLENAYYVLTPSKKVSQDKVTLLNDFVKAIGAIPILLNYNEHDYATAAISHVPHIVASSLVNLVKSSDQNGLMKQLAAGGFKDITRIASASPDLWKQISLTNKDQILKILTNYIQQLNTFKDNLMEDDADSIFEFFNEANDYRNSFADPSTSIIEKSYSIMVDIPDELGIIGKIATLLSEHQISIKNIGIVHNREFENGVLKIIFYNNESQLKSIKILKSYNYTVYER
ncbi:prephenate dehydrogenase [Natranaerovirga hydrolytica]|uniref:Prephenate dehydrogenase n=2 Tax=Natranaerovirga hydrolytica TaxID=680378 RepID=A0A4R1MJG7_9FIRM|nr:prephenate dehydrogenase [Natranaerovirga hydrolytica]